MDQDTVGVKQLQSGFRFRNALICLVVCVLCVGVTVSYVAFIINTPPTDFPLHTVTMIEKGASLSSISTALHEQHIIGSSSLFKLLRS